jgi:hypothetical protein
VPGFAERLLREGYTRASAEQHLCFIAHLDRWMAVTGLDVTDLSGSVIERYLAERRTAGYVEYRSVKALRPLLDLAPLGVLPVPQAVPPGPVEELLGRSYVHGWEVGPPHFGCTPHGYPGTNQGAATALTARIPKRRKVLLVGQPARVGRAASRFLFGHRHRMALTNIGRSCRSCRRGGYDGPILQIESGA